MAALLRTGGEHVSIHCEVGWLERILREGADGRLNPGPGTPSVVIEIESSRSAFDTSGMQIVARGVHRGDGTVVLQDACSSGMDLAVRLDGEALHITGRWRPSRMVRAAAMALPSRSRLLLREVLLQYPALFRAELRGRAPLHASVCRRTGADGGVVLLAGPSGVGKSTLVQQELARGGTATSDNLCVSDGTRVWGVVEPLRVATGGRGRRMPHGRRETTLSSRAEELVPDTFVVLERGRGTVARTRAMERSSAERALVAGTFMACELRRYWPLASTLALGFGTGPAAPGVAAIAHTMAARLPTYAIELPATPDGRGLDLPAPSRVEREDIPA